MTPKKDSLPLSVLIIARNEAKYIDRALKTVQFAEEIIVVDGGSSDQTREISAELGATVIEREWTGFRDQRNFAIENAKHDWVFFIDADEAVTPDLEDWLRDFFQNEHKTTTTNGFKIRRVEYFLGKEIQGACWNPSFQDRLLRKGKAEYIGEIHEYPKVEGGLVRAPQKAALLHNPNVTVESFLEKMNRYTTVEAWDRYSLGGRTNLLHLFVTFFSTWFKNYFYYKAYRDGTHGFVISVMEAVSRTVRHIKLWQIQKMKTASREDLLLKPDEALQTGALIHRGLESKGAK